MIQLGAVLEWVVWLGVVAEGMFFVGCRVAGRRCVLRFFGDCVGVQEQFLCIMCFLIVFLITAYQC